SSSLERLAPQLEGYAQRESELLEQMASARAAVCLANNGVDIASSAFPLPNRNLAEATAAEEQALAARNELRHQLREVLPGVNRRLELGIGLALANIGEES